MIDPNSPDPSKRKSFFDEDTMDDGGNDHPAPRADQRIYNDRERMASRYHEEEEDYGDQDYDRRKPARFGFLNSIGGGGGNGNDYTRRFAYAAGGIGGLLVLFIGGWMIFNSSNKGVPVFEPPAEVAKVKPANAGNVETIGMGVGDTNTATSNANGQSALMPEPEKANPQGLADQYNRPPPVVKPANPEANTNAQASSSENEGNNTNVGESSERPKAVVHPKHQQSRHTNEAKKAESKKVEAKKAEPKKTEPKKTAKKSEAAQSSSGKFGIQLASLKSHEAAQAQWQFLKKKAPDVLGKYAPSIQKAEVNGTVVYRLRVKGLESKGQVNTVCGQLKAKGVACTIAY